MTTFTSTRSAWHAVAESVLAGPAHRATGDIRLRVTPGGFTTWQGPALRVDHDALIAGKTRESIHGHTCAQLAEAAGVVAGPPENLYADGSGVPVDAPLHVAHADTVVLAQAFGIGDEALRRLAAELGPASLDGSYLEPVLWPEHFDVAITHDEVNFGVSPGDTYLDEPYAYVGPWAHQTGEFWNAPFGAARPVRELAGAGADGVLRFFVEGKERLSPSGRSSRSLR